MSQAWDTLKAMVTEFEQGTEHFPDPDLHKTVVERAMDVIESASAVAMLAKDGIEPQATMAQLIEAVEAFDDLSKPRMAQGEDNESTEMVSLQLEPLPVYTVEEAARFILKRMTDTSRPHSERFPEEMIEEGCLCLRLIETVLAHHDDYLDTLEAEESTGESQ